MKTHAIEKKLFCIIATSIVGVSFIFGASSCQERQESSDDRRALAIEVAKVITQKLEQPETSADRRVRKNSEYRERAQVYAQVFKDAGIDFGTTKSQSSPSKASEEEASNPQKARKQGTRQERTPPSSTVPEDTPSHPQKPSSQNQESPAANAPPPPPPPGPFTPPSGRQSEVPAWAKIDGTLLTDFNVAGKDVSSNKAKQLRIYLGEFERAPERYESLFAYFGLPKKPEKETPAEKILRERQIYYFGPPLLGLDGTEIDETTTKTPEGRAKFWQAVFAGASPLSRTASSRMPVDLISEITTRIDSKASAAKNIIITHMKPFVRLLVFDRTDPGAGPAYEGMKKLSEDLADAIGGSGGIGAGANEAARGGVWFWFRKNASPVTDETPGAMRDRFNSLYDDFLANASFSESFQEWFLSHP